MTWQEVRLQYPNSWVLIEALQAHSDNGRRIIEQMQVLKPFADIRSALSAYDQQHDQAASREFLVVHSSHAELQVEESRWLGIRSAV